MINVFRILSQLIRAIVVKIETKENELTNLFT